MMKILSKITFSLTLFGFALSAQVSSAQILPVSPATTSAPNLSCVRLEAFAEKSLAQIALLKKSLAEKKKNPASARHAERRSGISLARTREEADMALVFGNLEKFASTEAEKAGVKEFKKAVVDASAIRKAIVDKATQEYTESSAAALSLQEQKIADAIALFEKESLARLDSAKTDCAKGTLSVSELQSSLKSGLVSAKSHIQQGAKDSKIVKETIDSLSKKQKLEILRADQDYRGALGAAKRALKKAFQVSE